MSKSSFCNTTCGYCGKDTGPNGEAEHVVPRSLYSPLADPCVTRLTIPSCRRCNKGWSKHETAFKEVLISCGTTLTRHHAELWKGMKRNHERGPEGAGWRRRWLATFADERRDDGTVMEGIAAFREHSFSKVAKKIVRGLVFYDRKEVINTNARVRIGPNADELNIDVNELRVVYEFPEIFTGRVHYFTREENRRAHSLWSLDFYGQNVRLVGLVNRGLKRHGQF